MLTNLNIQGAYLKIKGHHQYPVPITHIMLGRGQVWPFRPALEFNTKKSGLIIEFDVTSTTGYIATIVDDTQVRITRTVDQITELDAVGSGYSRDPYDIKDSFKANIKIPLFARRLAVVRTYGSKFHRYGWDYHVGRMNIHLKNHFKDYFSVTISLRQITRPTGRWRRPTTRTVVIEPESDYYMQFTSLFNAWYEISITDNALGITTTHNVYVPNGTQLQRKTSFNFGQSDVGVDMPTNIKVIALTEGEAYGLISSQPVIRVRNWLVLSENPDWVGGNKVDKNYWRKEYIIEHSGSGYPPNNSIPVRNQRNGLIEFFMETNSLGQVEDLTMPQNLWTQNVKDVDDGRLDDVIYINNHDEANNTDVTAVHQGKWAGAPVDIDIDEEEKKARFYTPSDVWENYVASTESTGLTGLLPFNLARCILVRYRTSSKIKAGEEYLSPYGYGITGEVRGGTINDDSKNLAIEGLGDIKPPMLLADSGVIGIDTTSEGTQHPFTNITVSDDVDFTALSYQNYLLRSEPETVTSFKVTNDAFPITYSPNDVWEENQSPINGFWDRALLGHDVALNSAGDKVAVAAAGYQKNPNKGDPYDKVNGYIEVWYKEGGEWVRKGDEIEIYPHKDIWDWWYAAPSVENQPEYVDGRCSIAMNEDGNIVVIASEFFDRTEPTEYKDTGYLLLYYFDEDEGIWTQGDEYRHAGGISSVTMNKSGTRVAAGDNRYDGRVDIIDITDDFKFKPFTRLSADWNSWDKFGAGVSMSDDGSILAVGATGYDQDPNTRWDYNWYYWHYRADRLGVEGRNRGAVQVFEYIPGLGRYTQKGQTIVGDADKNFIGKNISISGDGKRLAIGNHNHDGDDGYEIDRGKVKVYQYSGTQWIQIGNDIKGENSGDKCGVSVSLNSDGSRVAIGSPGANEYHGHMRVFEYSAGDWNQISSSVEGGGKNHRFGYSISLNAAGDYVAVGNRVGKIGINEDIGRGSVSFFEFNGVAENENRVGVFKRDDFENGAPKWISSSNNHIIKKVKSTQNNDYVWEYKMGEAADYQTMYSDVLPYNKSYIVDGISPTNEYPWMESNTWRMLGSGYTLDQYISAGPLAPQGGEDWSNNTAVTKLEFSEVYPKYAKNRYESRITSLSLRDTEIEDLITKNQKELVAIQSDFINTNESTPIILPGIFNVQGSTKLKAIHGSGIRYS